MFTNFPIDMEENLCPKSFDKQHSFFEGALKKKEAKRQFSQRAEGQHDDTYKRVSRGGDAGQDTYDFHS